MKKNCHILFKHPKAFSLAEILAALMIGSMILVAVIGVYNRAQASSVAVNRKLDSTQLPSEVLQRIAEDLDNIVAAGKDTKITIDNKIESHGYSSAKLEILKTIYDKKDKPQVFEKITWQTNYDYESETEGLILYRSHSGIAVEDKLLDEEKEKWERELFVPVCNGITFFKIQVPSGEILQEQWSSDSLPHGVVVTISFAEPFKSVTGNLEVYEDQKITRTIAVDRTRKIGFIIEAKDYEAEENQINPLESRE